MRTIIRHYALTMAVLFGMGATAQTTVTITGTVSPCAGLSYAVYIASNTAPGLLDTVQTGPDCTYSYTFNPIDTQGTVTVSTSCDGGVTFVSATGTWTPFFPVVTLDLACNGASGPVNDECSSGTVIEVGTSCVPTSGDLTGATESLPPIPCAGFVSTTANDVWYRFTATGTTTTVQVTGDGNLDLVLEVLADSCGVLGMVNCADETIGGGTETLTLFTVPGQSYLYRIYMFTFSAPTAFTFSTCVISDNSMFDCENVEGGTAMPGTPCDDGNPATVNDMWNVDCVCTGAFTPPCNACFTVSQANGGGILTPFTANFTNCTSGNAPFVYDWGLPDGTASTEGSPTFVFDTAGVYEVCLTITDANACTSTLCDMVFVDANGGINTGATNFDCLMIANGPNLPGTPCTDPATGEAGLWSADCVCLPDSSSSGCQAGFWVVQAYTYTDTINNPGGGVEPIPNEVWVWNLSSGGDGNYQFFWSFGDGSSSTEAYPTHVYATGGPYQLCLTMTDGSGCTSTYCDDVSVDEDGLYTGLIVDGRPGLLRSGFTISVRSEQPTAITERELVENVALWPNPVEDVIGLSFNSLNNASLSLTIFDLNGRVVRSTNTVVNTGQNDQRIHVADLEAGMYLLQITNGEQRTSRRFVKR